MLRVGPRVRADWQGLRLGETVLEEWAKEKQGKRAHAISVHWPLLAMFLCKLFCVLKEFFYGLLNIPPPGRPSEGVLAGGRWRGRWETGSLVKEGGNIFNANIMGVRRIKGSCRTLVSFGCRFPVLSTYDGQTHLTLLINVRVVDLGFKWDPGRFKGVFCRECDLNPERTFVVWRVVLKKKMGSMRNV